MAEGGARVSAVVIRGWVPPFLSRFAPPEHRGQIERAEFGALKALRLARCLWMPGHRLRPLTNVLRDRAVETALERSIAAQGADLIHAHTETLAPAALAVAQRHGIPLIVTLHGENTNARLMTAPRQKARFRAALSGAARLVIVGEPLRPYAERLSGRKGGIVTVWNGVEAPKAPRSIPAPDTAPVQMICTANLQEGKGVDLLLSALGRLEAETEGTAWRLTVIGDGPLRDALERQAHDLGIGARVVFTGALTPEEVFAQLRQGDVFILPSYREAFGIAYLEAMASGLLTIGVEGQGPAQFIEHGTTGFLLPPRDVTAIETLLRAILRDRGRRWRGVAKAGEHVARHAFTWQAHAEKLRQVYREAIDAAKATERQDDGRDR